MRDVTQEDRAAILSRMKGLEPGRDDMLREAGRLLSALTGAAAVVTTPRPNEEHIAQLRFLELREDAVLAVIVTSSGAVQNRVVPLPAPLGRSELERVNNYLAELTGERSLAEVRQHLAREMEDQRGEYQLLRQRARQIVEATSASGQHRGDIVIEGQGRLFDRPEFADADKLRGYLRAFEEKEKLLAMLDRTLAAGGVQVLIGSETELADVSDVSVISANYRQSGTPLGALGVIGPTRMDYAKVVPLVGFTAQCMTELLTGVAEDKDDGRDLS
jgi:heat-inducible transcriptional repressor